MNLDPTTLAVGAAVGGGVGSLAALVIVAFIVRYVFSLWREFDAIRTQSLTELRAQNAELRARVEALERSSSIGI
jgi:hypothetical protein